MGWQSHPFMFHGHPALESQIVMTQPGLCPVYYHLAPSPPMEVHSGTQAPAPGPAFSRSLVLVS